MIGWLDCGAGASGDMLLGALVDAGAPLEVLQEAVDAVGVEPVRLRTEQVERGGLAALRVHVDVAESATRRTWADVRGLLEAADLPVAVRATALAVFARLAAAEAAVHRVPPDQVHFHEVGALDAVADVVGAAAGWHALGLTGLTASAVALGSGSTRGAHGPLPVPAPAVLALLAGAPVHAGPVEHESTTPTGAAVLAELAQAWGPLPPMTVRRVGTGAGGRDPVQAANVLRLVIGDAVDLPTRGPDAVDLPTRRPDAVDLPTRRPDAVDLPTRRPDAVDLPTRGPDAVDLPDGGTTGDEAAAYDLLVEANVDDLDPRVWPGVLSALLADGAYDAWLTPVLMKKGRPAHVLSVLCPARVAAAVRRTVLTQTSTIGLREGQVTRTVLDREEDVVDVLGQPVRVKRARLSGEVVNSSPEWDDVAAAALALGLPAKLVLARAVAAALA